MTTSTTTWDAMQKRLDALQRPTVTFTICEDPEAKQRLTRAKNSADEADQALAAASAMAAGDAGRATLEAHAKDAKTELTAAQRAFDKAAITLRFTALERKELAALQTAHPPTEEDEAEGDDFHSDTFAPALISAASQDGMPVDYARHCLNSWSAADARALWNAAWQIQFQQRTDLGKG
ncbi:hypothetical protein [Streptomyces sp. NPDC055105]|uniref:hypothetical protein n=1 Tax=Streptomyces sp. NPDC055105 TaxID=3365719 RepID=UPI0037D88CF6